MTKIKKKTKKVIKDIKAELKTVDPNLEITITQVSNPKKVMTTISQT